MIRRLAVLLALLPSLAGAEMAIHYIPPPGVGPIGGSFTANCIPYASSTTTLLCTPATSDGTNITIASGQLLLPAGTESLPSFAIGGEQSGLHRVSAGVLGLSLAGVRKYQFLTATLRPDNTGVQSLGTSSVRWSAGYFGGVAGGAENLGGAQGETRSAAFLMESITLSTSGTTTDSSANLLPANSIIEAVVCRVTTTITTATDWSVGDPTTAARFSAANATLAAGTTSVGLAHAQGSVATDAAGAVQVSAAKLRITTTGTPGAGVVRCTVFYRQFVAPTS